VAQSIRDEVIEFKVLILNIEKHDSKKKEEEKDIMISME
jgi:hypothetical protein